MPTMPDKPPLPKPAQPRHGNAFDPWNSVALGHQRAESRGPGGWRENRTAKLHSQFNAGPAAGRRLHDVVGPNTAPPPRASQSVLALLRTPGAMKPPPPPAPASSSANTLDGSTAEAGARPTPPEPAEDAAPRRRRLFAGLTVYVNGSTHPLISDHRLKRVLAEHGARTALHLGRRQVTHVIVGRPAVAGGGAGAGGGLAGGKIQREVRRVGGVGVKYVGVEWVLESLKAGIRLPEARFATVSIAPQGQRSVLGAFPASRHRDGTGDGEPPPDGG